MNFQAAAEMSRDKFSKADSISAQGQAKQQFPNVVRGDTTADYIVMVMDASGK